MGTKPLNIKNYGSIPHLPKSRMGPADKHCPKGQARIATKKARDSNDEIFVQEKLDGSNVGIAKKNGKIFAISRAGYTADSSPYEQHHFFGRWVRDNYMRFDELLREGERLAGEWLAQAHGTRYNLTHEPFVGFDLLVGHERTPYDDFINRLSEFDVVIPNLIHRGDPISVSEVMKEMGTNGFHGALDEPEGAVWRVERDKATGKKGEKKRVVDFLVKYVRPEKEDGKYFPQISGKEEIWNWRPDSA
jgi:hypothetical protein